ncbi:interferon-inducible GTPase-domain-containing protein, partial [Tirmania nivea]
MGNSHGASRRRYEHEQWEREQREYHQRMEHERWVEQERRKQEWEERMRMEAEQRAREEREERERQRMEMERYEEEMRRQTAENERRQREAEQRAQEEQQRQIAEEKIRQDNMRRQTEEMERQRREHEAQVEAEQRKRMEEEQRVMVEMARKEAAAREERERLQRKADEEAELQRIKHEEEQRKLEEESQARLAAQEAENKRILEEQQDAARREKEGLMQKRAELKQRYMSGIQPEVWPTEEERKKAEARLFNPKEEYFHCAIAGLAGSGKSSLINAFRGLRNGSTSPEVAPTGVTETTLEISVYPDLSPEPSRNRFVWYDVPGAGTIEIKGWQYFNSHGLFVFDLMIVVIDNRFSEQDLIILQHCERYKIPSVIVRSKANQNIRNIMKQELGWERSEDEQDEQYEQDERNYNEVYMEARNKLITKTRTSVEENLCQPQAGNLDTQKKVYIVSSDALVALVRNEPKKLQKENQLIHEPELLEAVYTMARRLGY